MSGRVIFISAIDTDAGKTVATGALGAGLLAGGFRVITQKLAQTGCVGKIADDIIVHRRLMGSSLNEWDERGLTCPYVFEFPASPHLAAELAGSEIDTGVIDAASRELCGYFDFVLIEGVGGLMVPLTRGKNVIDFVAERSYPLVLVASAKLGSINHTLLSLDACHRRGIELKALIFNHHPQAPKEIFDDTGNLLKDFLAGFYPSSSFMELPVCSFGPPCLSPAVSAAIFS